MKFSYNWLKELLDLSDSPQKLAEFLTLRVFEIESMAKRGKDWTLDVKILPNRVADSSGHLGLAREISALKKQPFKIPVLKLDEKGSKTSDLVQVKIENPDDCGRYLARVVKGVGVKPSPSWLREKLETCGPQSVNNIVDAANYVMLETGQPLHVFDADKLSGTGAKKIIVRRAKAGEKFVSLDDKTYILNPEVLVIADEEKPLAIAGIKGGKDSGVSESTRTVILESANFDPVRIRRSSQALSIKTDASYRFEHGLDPNQAEYAIDELAQLLQQLSGGEISRGRRDEYPKPLKQTSILLRPEYASRLLGINPPLSFYKDALKSMGWDFKIQAKNFVIKPPTCRMDIKIEEDVIEEFGRLWGYENIPARPPKTSVLFPSRTEELSWIEKIRETAIGAGFTESSLYEFTGDAELAKFNLIPEKKYLELENPTSPETKYLVPRALLKYVSSAAENLKTFDNIKIFGLAKSFCQDPEKEMGVDERKDLIFAMARKGTSGKEEFYQLKGFLDEFLEGLGVSDYWYDDAPGQKKTELFFHPFRSAEIKIGDEKIGEFGEIHPLIANNLKSKARIATAEIYFTKLCKLANAECEFRPVGKYPAVIRDISVIVPAETRTEEILNVIENAGGKLLIDTDLFDYFEDEQTRENEQKSLAFHLVFQSAERTLTDEEVKKITDKIYFALKETGWEIKE